MTLLLIVAEASKNCFFACNLYISHVNCNATNCNSLKQSITGTTFNFISCLKLEIPEGNVLLVRRL